MDSSRLEGVETLADIKGLGIGESSGYVSFRAEQGQLKPIDRRVVKVQKEYCKAAKDLGSKYHMELAFRVEFKGEVVGSVARWPLREIEKLLLDAPVRSKS